MKEIARVKAQLLVISFASLPELEEWVPFFRESFLAPGFKDRNLPLPADLFARTRFAADPELSAYHAYGLGRNSPLRVYGPRIAWQYFRWGLMGKPLKMPAQDTLQRGGDFVVGRDGRLRLAHVGRDQADRPSLDEVLNALKGFES